jgi:acyl-coenzyme A synthetase/AMP-(fatty) acid ligase
VTGSVRDFPEWVGTIPDRFNIGVACTDAHLGSETEKRVALIIDDATHGARQLTYAELAAQTSRFAQLLREIGIAPGDRLLIRLPNCIAYPIAFLGAMKCGAVPVPTSIQLTEDEVVHLARDSGAVALVTDGASWTSFAEALDGVATLRHVIVSGHAAPVRRGCVEQLQLEQSLAEIRRWEPSVDTAADDPAYLVYTSGTTGYPKGVLHAHRALLGRQPASRYWFDFQPSGDRVLHAGKFNWTYVLGTGLTDPLFRGHTAILYEGATDPSVWPRLIAKHRATIFIAVPTIYRQIVQHTDADKAAVPYLRHCMSAGEPLSDQVLDAWRRRFGLDIYEALGMTECSYYLCQTKERPIRLGSPGFVQPGHRIDVLDPETLTPVEPGIEGMICIREDDPGLMLRYWNQPEETRMAFRDEWFLTGDYASRDADGYVAFLGRRDDLINTFGYRVSPHEVERVLKDHPQVADAAVVGEEVSPGKTLVAAYVIARESSLREQDVLDFGRRHLAAYKAPRIVYVVDEFPRTRVGKTLRRALRPDAARSRAVSE